MIEGVESDSDESIKAIKANHKKQVAKIDLNTLDDA